MADDKLFRPEFSCLLCDIKGSEGPVFDKHGELFMVAPEVESEGNYAGQILHVNLSTRKAKLLVAPSVDGYGGIPAGCQVDRDNNIWVADMRLGLLKVNTDGTFTQVAKRDCKGECMQGCNDCAFDYAGNLWITAPAGDIAPAPYIRSSQEPFGSIYCYTKDGKMMKVASGYLFSNGIAVQHTEDEKPKKLIVAETFTKTLWGYDIVGDGQIENKHSWGVLPGSLRGGPDGIDFDSAGNLLAAHHGSGHIEVFGPEGGRPIYRIKCPFDKPSNIHFKPNTSEVYVTEHDSHGLWKFEWIHTGAKQYCDLPM